MRPLTVDDATLAMVVTAVVIALVPKVRHFILYTKLQISLVSRLGPIWAEEPGIRTPAILQTNFLSELDEIEKRYGPQMTNQERGLVTYI